MPRFKQLFGKSWKQLEFLKSRNLTIVYNKQLALRYFAGTVRMYKQPRWSKWEVVYDRWLSHSVPNINIMPFKIGEHNSRLPWVDRQSKRQYFHTNPQFDTAYHLTVVLPKESDELRAAYKLYAFFRRQRRDYGVYSVLHPIFKLNKFELSEWWNANACYVLPPLDYTTVLRYQKLDSLKWDGLIDEAAITWIQLAKEWALIQIPDFMEDDSSEYQAYEHYVSKKYEAKEREELERLKRKFEGL